MKSKIIVTPIDLNVPVFATGYGGEKWYQLKANEYSNLSFVNWIKNTKTAKFVRESDDKFLCTKSGKIASIRKSSTS